MKNFILFIILLCTVNVFAQLESDALFIKNKYPEGYNIIKYYASQEWGSDHEMVVYQINNQAEALINLLVIFEPKHTNILYRSLQEWSYPTFLKHTQEYFEKEVNAAEISLFLNFHVDWEMVEYTYKNQVSAKGSY